MPPKKTLKHRKGFTLAELLITLAILGEIVTFTIPKIINAQANGKYKAIAKEDIASIMAAYSQITLTNGSSVNIGFRDLTPYINYAYLDQSGVLVDDDQASTTEDCNPNDPCLRMHNGSTIKYAKSETFAGSSPKNAFFVHIDPDGTVNSNSKAVAVFVYYNGRVTDEGHILPNTVNSDGVYNPDSSKVPPWFTW